MKSRGFTLIELIIVIAIVGIIASVVIPKIEQVHGIHQASATFPSPNWVVDDAGLLQQSTINYMRAQAKMLAESGGPEIAVVTVKSIAPMTIEEYSIILADKWKVGKKGKDNGIIEIVALKERKMRIEVGRGLEGVLNDAKAGRIINDVMRPHLGQGKFDEGIRAGFEAIVLAIKGEK